MWTQSDWLVHVAQTSVWGARLGGSYAGRRAGVVFGTARGAMGGLFCGTSAAAQASSVMARIVELWRLWFEGGEAAPALAAVGALSL